MSKKEGLRRHSVSLFNRALDTVLDAGLICKLRHSLEETAVHLAVARESNIGTGHSVVAFHSAHPCARMHAAGGP